MTETPATEPTELRTEHLRVGYDRAVVIPDLDLTIPTGAITAIVGPNACGKSTLLKTIARLLAPQQGQVILDGTAIHRLPTATVARRLGLLPQSPETPEGLVVEDLVARGRHPHHRWLQRWSTEDQAAVEDALRATATTDLRHRRLDELSGGQRQRAWIAMIVAQHTPLLLLDEPTTYLDLAHQLDVLTLLRELNRTQHRTIVVVLHDINHAIRHADHLVALREGELAATGPPAETVTTDLLRDVFGVTARILTDPQTGHPICVPESSVLAQTVSTSQQ